MQIQSISLVSLCLLPFLSLARSLSLSLSLSLWLFMLIFKSVLDFYLFWFGTIYIQLYIFALTEEYDQLSPQNPTFISHSFGDWKVQDQMLADSACAENSLPHS